MDPETGSPYPRQAQGTSKATSVVQKYVKEIRGRVQSASNCEDIVRLEQSIADLVTDLVASVALSPPDWARVGCQQRAFDENTAENLMAR